MSQLDRHRDPSVTIENVRFLLASGEHPDRIARRLDYQPDTLARQLARWGLHDLASTFDRQSTKRSNA